MVMHWQKTKPFSMTTLELAKAIIKKLMQNTGETRKESAEERLYSVRPQWKEFDVKAKLQKRRC